ncbi:MAG: OmpH family outer membrane protein [Planctomycetota bacterium]|jgi:Skp family chaperone for outer membrane proteins
MRKRHYVVGAILVVVVSFAALSLLFARGGSAQARRVVADVAVCDVLEVFRNYDRANDLTQQMQQRRDAIIQERDSRIAEIEALQEELRAYLPGSEEFEAKLREIELKTIEAGAWEEFQMTMAGHDHHRLMTEMYDEILAMAKTIADERGHKVVLFRESLDTRTENMQQLLAQIEGRKVLHASPDVDLTNIIIDRLNSLYTGGN